MRRAAATLSAFVIGTTALGLGALHWLQEGDQEPLNQGRHQMAAGNHVAAVATLGKVGGDPVSSETALEARLLICRALLAAGNPERAAREARTLAEVLPADHRARGRSRALLAEAALAMGKAARSARLYEESAVQALSQDHRNRVAGHYLALAAEMEAERPAADPLEPPRPPQPARAAELYGKALEVLTGGEPLARVTLPRVRALLAAEKPAPASQRLAALLDAGERGGLDAEGEAEARYLLARAAMMSGQASRALDALRRLAAVTGVQETPYAARGWRLRGRAYLAAGDVPEAVSAWETFLERWPGHEDAAEVRLEIARAWYSAERMQKAAEGYALAAAAEGAGERQRAESRFRMGEANHRLARWEPARKAYKQFLAGHPDDERVPEAQKRLQRLYLDEAAHRQEAGDLSGALGAYRSYLEAYPLGETAPEVAVEVGLLLRRLEKPREALEAFLAARDRYRRHDQQQAARAAYLAGVVREEDLEELEAAIRTYRRVVEEMDGTGGARAAAARIRTLESVELHARTPHLFAPGEETAVRLTARNVPAVTVRLYQVDARDTFEQRGSLQAMADVEVALVKADRTFTFEVPGYVPHLKKEVPLRLGMEAGKDLPEGAWLVALQAKERRVVVPVVVSSLRLVVKRAPREVFCWAVDAATGEPREGVEVLVRGPGLRERLETDAGGVARLELDEEAPKQVHVLGADGDAVAPGLVPEAPEPGAGGLAPRVAFTLDRPLYRPGETVAFHAFLRAVARGDLVTPEPTEVSAALEDPRGRVLDTATLESGSFGSVHGRLDLPPDGPVGDHRLKLAFAGHTFTQKIPVQAYTVPEFQVTVEPGRRVVAPGETAEVKIHARYFFGGPVRHAPVTWSALPRELALDRARYRSHAWYLRAVNLLDEPGKAERLPFVGVRGSTTTDEQGNATIEVPVLSLERPHQYQVVARVRGAGRWVHGTGRFSAGPVDRFAVVVADRRTYRTGDTTEVRVITPDLTQEPVRTRGRLLLLRRHEDRGETAWEQVSEAAVDTGLAGEAVVRVELDAAGTYRLRFEGRDRDGSPVTAETGIEVSGEAPEDGELRLRFERAVCKAGEAAPAHLSVPQPGRPVLITYEGERVLRHRILRPASAFQVVDLPMEEELAPNVTVAAAVPEGHELLTSQDRIVVLRYLEVAVEPGAAQAAPGATLQVEVRTRDQAGTPCQASVVLRAVDAALEQVAEDPGQDIRFVFNQDKRPHLVATGSSFAFSSARKASPLDPDLLALEEAEARKEALDRELAKKAESLRSMEREEADLGRPARTLDATERQNLADEPASKRPGDKRITAFGMGGGATGGFGARHGGGARQQGQADSKTVLLLNADRLPSRDVPVTLGASISGKVQADFNGLLSPGLDAYQRLEAPQPLEFRRRFVEVAGWWPEVRTDGEGRATLELELPDNLTTWTFTGQGATRATAVGRGTAALRVSKELMLRLHRPSFLASGDRLELPAVLHSRLDRVLAGPLRLRSLDPEVLRISGLQQLELDIPAEGRRTQRFTCEASGAGSARLEAAMQADGAGDAVKAMLPVQPFGEPWSMVRRATVGSGRPLVMDVAVEPDRVTGSARYRVVVRAGLEADILEGLGYLASYPYSCLEQTVHRFLPAAVAHRTLERLGRPPLLEAGTVRHLVEHGISHLHSFQRDDGTFAFWPRGPSHAWATALALDALARTAELGFRVDPGFLKGARNGARRLLREGGTDPEARAALLLAAVRAGAREGQTLNVLFRARERLSVQGLSRLLLAAVRAKRPGLADRLLVELRGRRLEGPVPFRVSPRLPWLRSTLETQAWALLALCTAGATGESMEPLVEAVRRGLQRRDGATKGVAVAVEALAAKVARDLETRAGRVTVSIGGREAAAGRLVAGSPATVLEIPESALPPGRHQVAVAWDGGGEIACTLELRHMRKAVKVEPAGNLAEVRRRVLPYEEPGAGPGEERGWKVVKPESRPGRVERPGLPETVLGRRVTVEILVEARETLHQVVVEDPQVAGLQPVEEGLRVRVGDGKPGRPARTEKRRGRMLVFLERLPAGRRVRISYPAYAAFAGAFRALPVRVEEMYAPDRGGRSGSTELGIVPDPTRLARIEPPEPTPDELHGGGMKAFKEERWSDAAEQLGTLLERYDLREDVHDGVLHSLLLAELHMERWSEAVEHLDRLRLRNPDRLDLAPWDRVRLGRAYLALEEPEQARTWFTRVVQHGFHQEVAVAGVYKDAGRPLKRVQHLLHTLDRYPPWAGGATRLAAGEALLEILRPDEDGRLAALPPAHRVRWREALDVFLGVMAWHAGSALAESAHYRRLEVLAARDRSREVVEEAQRYLEHHPHSGRVDAATYHLARGRFDLGSFEEAARAATAVWEHRREVTGEDGVARKVPSPYRDRAGYLLGQVAHVQGDLRKAVAWYGRVRGEIPDARRSWEFFTGTELEVEPFRQVEPGSPVSLSVGAKNVETVTTKLYPVDLLVLFAVKKDLEAMVRAELAGIRPAGQREVETGLEPYVSGSVEVPLGSLDPGAYLVVVQGGGSSTSSLVLASRARISVQREGGDVRLYLVDGSGRAVAGARVKAAAGGRIVHSGTTDERGIATFSLGDGKAGSSGSLTVVAVKEDLVAVARSRGP